MEKELLKKYKEKEWFKFKEKIFELDNYTCVKCNRSRKKDGIILQVHHKEYIKDKKPWEYDINFCETLCKCCHAEEHGKIMPQSGWIYDECIDLGEPCDICERCNSEIRYAHHIYHPQWGDLIVGATCADKLTQNKKASNLENRIKNFCNKNWEIKNNIYYKTFLNKRIKIRKIENYYIPEIISKKIINKPTQLNYKFGKFNKEEIQTTYNTDYKIIKFETIEKQYINISFHSSKKIYITNKLLYIEYTTYKNYNNLYKMYHCFESLDDAKLYMYNEIKKTIAI